MSTSTHEAITKSDAILPPQFVVDAKGQRTAVLMDMRSWELLSDWIETVTDAKIAQHSLRELEDAGGRPEQAGWLDWETIRDAWNDDEGS